MGLLTKARQKLAEKIAPPDRVTTAWDRLHREAGFIPLYNDTQTELRRKEVKAVLDECEDALFEATLKKSVCKRAFTLFFTSGNQWYRGLDNRELAGKVRCFLQNYTNLAYMEEYIPDLFEEAMQLLSLSWQSLDVTSTPPYIIESRPVVFPKPFGSVPEMEDKLGQEAIQRELAEARAEKESMEDEAE